MEYIAILDVVLLFALFGLLMFWGLIFREKSTAKELPEKFISKHALALELTPHPEDNKHIYYQVKLDEIIVLSSYYGEQLADVYYIGEL